MDARLVDADFHHMPVPSNLCKQSESDGRGEVAERRSGRMFAADVLCYVTIDRTALTPGDFAHALERLAIGVNQVLAVCHGRIQRRRRGGKIWQLHMTPRIFS